MYTEELKAWQPWVCPGCSRELQFSERDGCVRQLFFIGVALLALYLYGFRGWHLFGSALIAGFLLAVILGAPLDRILPRRLEPYTRHHGNERN
jgi:hypothetical protein